MSKTVVNLIIDLLAGCLFLAMLATGYILHFPLPPRTNKTLTLWGMTRHMWGAVHFWISAGLLAVLLVHVVLHWQWIVTVIGRRLHLAPTSHSSPLRSGLVFALILALAFALFAWTVHQNVKPIAEQLPRGGLREKEKESDADESNQGIDGDRGPSQIAFGTDIYPLLEKRCFSCHGPSRQAGGFRADRRADYFEADGTNPLVVPGKSTESLLIESVARRQKNLRLAEIHRLSEEEVTLLKAWIDAGADWPAKPGP